jgi:hypothetical protein
MESVILIARRSYDPGFREKIPSAFKILEVGGGTTAVTDGATRIYICRNDSVRDELEPDELDNIASKISHPIFYTVDFSDISFCRTLLFNIADDPELLVDDDHGPLLPGPEFVQILRNNPMWDWRKR